MQFTSMTTIDGINEHLFILGDVHGVLWTSAAAADSRPLVQLGHGGGQHKMAPGVRARALRYVSAGDFDVAAIDAPGHGDRPRTTRDEERTARISAAVLGLVASGALAEAASRITVPVEFLLQWDDELVPRESGLALFDAFAAEEKTLHANPGRHMDVPSFELDSSMRFFHGTS
jgi:hypothetical protein